MEVVRGVHHAVVGDGDVLNPRLLGLFDVLGNASHAVEQGILGVQMQMCEIGQRMTRVSSPANAGFPEGPGGRDPGLV